MNVDAAVTAVESVVPAAPPPEIAPEIVPKAPEIQDAPVVATDKPKAPTIREGLEASMKALRERPRDEIGRFTQKQIDDAAKALDAKALPQPAPVVAAKPERPADMPKAWGADKAAQWATLPQEARAYVSERETQMEAFHAKHAALAPWQEAATANQTTLPEVLERVHAVESAMLQSPDKGLIRACQMVGLDRAGAVAALQGALASLGVQAAQPANGQTPPATLPPELQSMQTRLDGVERMFQTQSEQAQAAAMAKANETVAAFFADTKNEFANELKDDIARELRAMKAVGIPLDLSKAYERALWTRPDLRERLVAKQVAAKAEETAAARTQELQKARSASRSVAGSPPAAEGRSSADRPANLRDEIAMRVRNAGGRV